MEDETQQKSPTDDLKTRPQREVMAVIAERLGETERHALEQIWRIIRALGRTQAVALLEETERIEASGGMMVVSGSRRRTPGGVYFHLAYTTGKPKPGRKLERPIYNKAGGQELAQADQQKKPTVGPPQVFTWEDRIGVLKEIGEQKGRANTVKITLIGTLGKYSERGTFVMGVMQHTGEKLPALPKGGPMPQAVKTNYIVYIGLKQWKKIAEEVKDPKDALIIEGFPQIDAKTGAISVFATNVTTKKIEMARKEAQKAES